MMIGIYYLTHGKRIVYIGQSINISRRIKEHIKENTKKFDGHLIRICDKCDLLMTEKIEIEKFNPRYNIRGRKGSYLFEAIMRLREKKELSITNKNKDKEWYREEIKRNCRDLLSTLEGDKSYQAIDYFELFIPQLLTEFNNIKDTKFHNKKD